MRSAILLFVSVIFTASVRAQAVDSVLRTVTPITWNILLLRPDSTKWSGRIDTIAQRPDTVIVSSDSITLTDKANWYVNLILDSALRRLTLEYWQSMCCKFKVRDIPYAVIDSKIVASAYCTDAWMQPDPPGAQEYCLGGWVLIGGALPPASVLENPSEPNRFSIKELSGALINFDFTRAKNLRIFDLLGRECDRVAIPAGAESVDYNTSRLAPGLYIAQLGQQAVKFEVR